MHGAKQFTQAVCVIVLFFGAQHAFSAANFIISPYGALPTTVVKGQSVSATYAVTNLTNTIRNGYVLIQVPQDLETVP